MRAERFFDTNILIYAFAQDHRNGARAEELLEEGGVIGVQVLNEFTHVARRKLAWQWDEVSTALDAIDALLGHARPLTTATHAQAVSIAREQGLSIYDALIVAAALDAQCSSLVSEDFQHGRRFASLRIVNPFLSDAA